MENGDVFETALLEWEAALGAYVREMESLKEAVQECEPEACTDARVTIKMQCTTTPRALCHRQAGKRQKHRTVRAYTAATGM